MRIAIFGLGYVGTVSAACLAKLGHEVIGVDIVAEKVELVDSGRSPVKEPAVDELLREGREAGRLRATMDVQEAVRGSDMAWVVVGTPSRPTGEPETRQLERTCEVLGAVLRRESAPYRVVFRSTVTPGTTGERLIPLLCSASGRELGRDLTVAFHPEFLREGSSADDFFDPPLLVVGTEHDGIFDDLCEVYRELAAPVQRLGLAEAELLKYVCNAWHALKVAFANEIGVLGHRLGLDSIPVMEAFTKDRKLNISERYLRPGGAFGGSCLPKDLRALIHQIRHGDLQLPILEAVLPSNTRHLERMIDRVLASRAQRIGMLGLCFKSETDDLRESPLLALAEALIGKGKDLMIYDPVLRFDELRGANKRFLLETIPHISELLQDEPGPILDRAQLILVGHANPGFREIVAMAGPEQQVLDLDRLFGVRSPELACRYQGLLW